MLRKSTLLLASVLGFATLACTERPAAAEDVYQALLQVSGQGINIAMPQVFDPVLRKNIPNTATFQVQLAAKIDPITGKPTGFPYSKFIYLDAEWRSAAGGSYAYKWYYDKAAGTAWMVWPTKFKTAADEARLDLTRNLDGSYRALFRVRAWGGVTWYFKVAVNLAADSVIFF